MTNAMFLHRICASLVPFAQSIGAPNKFEVPDGSHKELTTQCRFLPTEKILFHP